MNEIELQPLAELESALAGAGGLDAVIVVAPSFDGGLPPELQAVVDAARPLDAAIGREDVLLIAPQLAGGRLVLAPTGPLERDHDDVRRFAETAARAVARARRGGAARPLLVLAQVPALGRYRNSLEAALLGALGSAWMPLEARERSGGGRHREEALEGLAFLEPVPGRGKEIARLVSALEAGRYLARDIGGSEPERMAPEGVATRCQEVFEGSAVHCRILRDPQRIRAEYPLMAAVARASMAVERHHPRVIRLEYRGSGPIERTILLAGKGLTYDTGGADLKVGGHMAGMSRDKGGGAAVIGLLMTVARLQPAGVAVIAEIGAVRNSIGADAYVADEILTSHAGVRVRVGNTDAEGRLVLADLLSHLRVQALDAPAPLIFSVATLTGHAARAVGPYSIAIENGPARAGGVAAALAEQGELWGEPFEISRLRREDWEFVQPRSSADDVLQCNNAPSVETARGHQFPMAFMAMAAGLDRHGGDSDTPLAYTHIDIAGSACAGGDWQHGRPSAAPLVAMARALVVPE